MRGPDSNRVRRREPNSYATREDFISVFSEDRNELFQLSLLLTGDHKKAEKCFVAGIENCVSQSRVFKEWARTWAKRIIVENAIRELRPHPSLRGSSSVATVFSHRGKLSDPGGHFDVDAVLGLEDFERFVFVMSVLEHYSHHECALLLGCSASEIREGRLHALEHLATSGQRASFAL
jgi:DNA-directed RNA polymerase specialized sigma24 family protein